MKHWKILEIADAVGLMAYRTATHQHSIYHLQILLPAPHLFYLLLLYTTSAYNHKLFIRTPPSAHTNTPIRPLGELLYHILPHSRSALYRTLLLLLLCEDYFPFNILIAMALDPATPQPIGSTLYRISFSFTPDSKFKHNNNNTH